MPCHEDWVKGFGENSPLSRKLWVDRSPRVDRELCPHYHLEHMSNTTQRPGWGIIGAGRIAAAQAADLRTAGLPLAAIGSRSIEKAQAFAERFDIPYAHGSYEALVSDPDVQIVYIATPHPMHAPHAILAAEAGTHVLVEKPFTLNAKEARAIFDAADKAGVIVMEAMWTRFLPMMHRIMNIISSGGIGDPRALLADHNQLIPYEASARLHEPELGGGALLDLGIYPLSFAQRIFGTPTRITARGTLTDKGVDELVAIIMEYGGGEQASIHTGFLTPGPNVASVVGSSGRIDIDRTWYNQSSFTHYGPGGEIIERYEDTIDGRGMQYQALELERLVIEGQHESKVMSREDTISIMEQMDEIRRQIGVTYPGE